MINKDNFVYYAGTALSQVITLLTTLYILYNFSPENFGYFSLVLSVTSIIGSLSTLKFELSVAISKDSKSAIEKLSLTIFVSVFLNILLSVIYFLFEPNIKLFILIIMSTTIAMNGSIQQYVLFEENHKLNGILPVLTAVLNLIFLLLLKGDNALIFAYILSSWLITALYIFWMLKKGRQYFILTFESLKKVFHENISFVKYIFPSSIATILIMYFHPILLSYLYNSTSVGLFSFALRILLLPSIIIGTVTGALLRNTLSRLYFNNEYELINKEIKKILLWLFISCLICFPILEFFVFQLKNFVNISKWNGIEHISVLIIFYAVSQFFFIPLSNIPLVFDRKKLLLKLNIIQLCLTLMIYLGAYLLKWQFETFLVILSIAMMIFSIISCYCFVRIVKVKNV
ncbi:oligosaccharide flippase family protein [Chryseobacterium sp. 22458]|uniref:oligosaccharide flippase family protein n=1 Tax=Chryseobacterium sp. 22458 TaxID=3453921 RepID=UPI003F84E988